MAAHDDYVLGHTTDELARLDRLAAQLAGRTRAILTLAGISAGMSVLDLGTGTGEVALLVAELVGPSGRVVGVEVDHGALQHAERKRVARQLDNVSFRQVDLADELPDGDYDAIVERLVLPFVPDPVAVVRGCLGRLRPGGVFVAMENDLTGSRSVPVTPLVSRVTGLVAEAFVAAGQPQVLGPHLAALLTEAGAVEATVLGLKNYLGPDDTSGIDLLVALVTRLLPIMQSHGLASAEELHLDTLGARLSAELRVNNAVYSPPILVGGWGRRPR